MAVTLREVRRPKGAPARRSLTAASQRINDPASQLKTSTMASARQTWQEEAWEHSEECGELSYYVSWRANSCSRTVLVASELDADTGLPTGQIDDENTEGQIVADYVRDIAGGPLGQAALIKRLTECLTIPGETWIAMVVRQEVDRLTGIKVPTEKWYALTNEEWKKKTGGVVEFDLPDGTKHEYNTAIDSFVRVWNPRPRKAREATSPVRACLEPLREIRRTNKKIKNAAKSRIMNNGVLFVPAQMSLPAAGQAPVPEGQANVPGAEVPTIQGVPAADQLGTLLYQASVASMEDDDAQTAYIPLIASVDAEHMDKVQHIKFGNEITDVEIKTRTDAITRLAMGLDVSPERLLGLSTGNHWSAWAIGDEDVQLHIKPVMDLICQAIYTEILAPLLRAEGIDPTKYTLWYDASGLTADPDLSDEAVLAADRGAIRLDVLRRLLGVGEDSGYDLETLEGCKVFARDVVAKNPQLLPAYAAAGLINDQIEKVDFPTTPAIGSGAADPPGGSGGQPSGADGQQEPNTENQDQQNQDQAAAISDRAEFLVAHRMGVVRALDIAGKRRFKINDRDQKARLRGRQPHEYHRVMGPVRADQIPELIKGWDSGLEDDVLATLGVDVEELRAAVRQTIRKELTRQVIDAEVL